VEVIELIKQYVCDYLSFLISKYGFSKGKEIYDDQSLSIEIRSNTFVVKIEKYRREIYITLFRPGYDENEIHLFNLIQYLFQKDNVSSNYFSEIEDLAECYRRQIENSSTALKKYYEDIFHFFNVDDFRSQLEEVNRYMQERYPELYKRR
jgi:hypothetical protein